MRFLILFISALFLSLTTSIQGQEFEVKSLPLNTGYNEFSPTICGDQLIFCSDRKIHTVISYLDANEKYPTKFYISTPDQTKAVQIPEIVSSPKINLGSPYYHEGSQTLWFCQSINTGDGVILGIYYCRKTANGWSEPVEFEYNSKDGNYSLCYPFLTPDGNTLYFSSDMPWGYGGKDIYKCTRKANGWSKPENLGETINTGSNEISPHIDKFGKLYFSSNRSESRKDYDIYVSQELMQKWKDPVALAEPLNSPFDDYSFISKPDGESGFFVSNRNQNQDDIFSFAALFPKFENCPPCEKPTFCYLFEETKILPNDSLPMIYEWEFGDGTKAKGLSTEHCYKTFGTYHIQLNVLDSLTKARFARVSEVDVIIEKSLYPFITAPDKLSKQERFEANSNETDIDELNAEEYYWNLGDGTRGRGSAIEHQYEQSGRYTIQLGLIGHDSFGNTVKRCATRTIDVGSAEELEALAKTMQSDHELIPSALQNDMYFMSADAENKTLKYVADSTLYFVEFKVSETPINLSDSYFENIKYEITERFVETDSVFVYSAGNTTELPVMIQIQKDLKASGYTESIIGQMKVDKFNRQTVNKWWFIPDSLEAGINRHLNKFNDIRFDYGTHSIRKESYADLNYLAQVLKSQPTLKLKINAYTDSIGSAEHNLKLSERRALAVIDYLVESKVNRKQLTYQGYGESKPIADNGTEKGRAMNRRVEFEIMIEADTKKKK